jgi:ADP-ribosylglycohydrolase
MGIAVSTAAARSSPPTRSNTCTLPDGLAAAVRAGDDTDTVAAIAGALLGARHGASAVPAAWRSTVHGWPGLTADDLVELAVRATG